MTSIKKMADDLHRGKYRIESARLADYDYGSNGMYFITICTRHRDTCLGEVVMHGQEATVVPSAIGQVAVDCWLAIPTFHPYVTLDAFQLMPDHLHAVIWICKPMAAQTDWQPNQFGPQRQNLASIIRGYKSGVTKHEPSTQRSINCLLAGSPVSTTALSAIRTSLTAYVPTSTTTPPTGNKHRPTPKTYTCNAETRYLASPRASAIRVRIIRNGLVPPHPFNIPVEYTKQFAGLVEEITCSTSESKHSRFSLR